MLAYSRHKDIGRRDLYARGIVHGFYSYVRVESGAERVTMLPPRTSAEEARQTRQDGSPSHATGQNRHCISLY